MKWSMIGVALALALVALGPGEAAAQGAQRAEAGRYSAVVGGGWTQYDDAAGLKDAAFGGFEVLYRLNRFLSVGPHMSVARPVTDEETFPLARMEFVDTVFTFLLNQQLTVFDFGVTGAVDVPLGPLSLQGLAGIGRYSVRLDRERSNRPVVTGTEVTGFSGMQYMLGGGVSVGVPGGALRAQVSDLVYTDYERDLLNLSDPLFTNTALPHPNPNVPEAKSTIHNLRYEVGFNFRIGGRR